MERFLYLMIAARALNATGLGLLFSASTDLLYQLVPQVGRWRHGYRVIYMWSVYVCVMYRISVIHINVCGKIYI